MNEKEMHEEHEKKYNDLIKKMGGLKVVFAKLPWSINELREKYEKDEHLNNIPLMKWDKIAGRVNCGRHAEEQGDFRLYTGDWPSGCSLAERVCILKQSAKRMVEQNLCPICGEKVYICGKTKDGRIYATCGDAFTFEQWEE